MDTATLKSCDSVATNVNSWLVEVLNQLKVDDVYDLTTPKCKTLNKDTLAEKLIEALIYVTDQNNWLLDAGKLKDENEALKSKLIDSQGKVISLQAELLSSRSEQLDTLQTTVKTSVEDTVKAGFLSYSAVAQKNTVISPETLKSVAKQLVVEEELSRNIMVFGLSEKDDEDICDSVGKVFEQLGEKPRLEARRLGIKRTNSTPRPVKVTLSSAANVQQILGKSRKLRTSQYDAVYLTPDRTAEQRAEHRQLVEQLKKKGEDQPGRHHYIKGGQIYSTELKNHENVLK